MKERIGNNIGKPESFTRQLTAKWVKIRALVVLTCFTQCLAWAQPNSGQLVQIPELQEGSIYDILVDKRGVIWLGTLNGLIQYDGYDIKRYEPDPNDTTTIGELLIYELYEDKLGYIWIGSESYIFKYNPTTRSFKSYPYNQLVNYPEWSRPVALTIEEINDRMYFGITNFSGASSDKTLLYYDTRNDSLLNYTSEKGIFKNAFASSVGPDGTGLFLTWEDPFQIDTNHAVKFIDPPSELNLGAGEFINGLTIGSDGTIWLLTNKLHLIAFNSQAQFINQYDINLFGNNVISSGSAQLTFGPNGYLWISTLQGLIYLSFQDESIQPQILSGTEELGVRSFHFDAFNNLWIGTENSGLFQYIQKPKLMSISGGDGQNQTTPGWVSHMHPDKNGNIWMGIGSATHPPSIDVFNPNTRKIIKKISLPFISVTVCGFIDDHRILLAGRKQNTTGQAHYSFDIRSEQITPTNEFEFFPPRIPINRLETDIDGNQWLSTEIGLYLKKADNAEFQRIELPAKGDLSNQVTKVFNGMDNTTWLLTNDGLFTYHLPSNEARRHGFATSKDGETTSTSQFTSQDINSMYQDSSGIVWVGTWKGGFHKYNPVSGQIRSFDLDDGLPSMSIQGIIGDEERNVIWLSTFNGISRFQADSEEFTNYNISDGIHGLLYSDGSYFKWQNDLFIFGGSNGISFLNPSEVDQQSTAPLVHLAEILVNDQSIYSEINNGTIDLSHSQNNLLISYLGIHYDDPDGNQFAYRMIPADIAWREVGNNRSAFYYNLRPGQYYFQVKAANVNGLWSEEKELLAIHISPPWWKTVVAYIAYITVFFSFLYGLYKYQKKRLLDKELRAAHEKELEQAKEIEKAYHQLKTTQSQLIHSEKMASLGELTAGIAHEIQNPLNFVNNFSDVSGELIDEAVKELENDDPAEAKEILLDLKENLSKINHHGDRASSIVKGMLDHSRTSTGERISTDINTLCDEYLRLAFHGMRARDKSFNAKYEIDFADHLPKIKIVPQDIGRVILNLLNNAFQAASASSVQVSSTNSALPAGKRPRLPTVRIATRQHNDQILITVSDNGPGIPEDIRDKIFQPFFTTKPTGQGTGLGLSLSYDIIKAHGGNILVATDTQVGTEFTVELPTHANKINT